MHETIDDPIDVEVSFHPQRVIPTAISWRRRRYPISHVHLVHATHEGRTRIFFFSVSDGTNAFKLRLDTDLLQWRLVELATDG